VGGRADIRSGDFLGGKRVKGKGSPYSITERRVPELIQVSGSQPAGDVSHKPDEGKYPTFRLPMPPSMLSPCRVFPISGGGGGACRRSPGTERASERVGAAGRGAGWWVAR